MTRLNKITVVGHVSSAPNSSTTSSGDAMTTFTIRVERPNAETQAVQHDEFTVVTFRDLASQAAGLSESQLILVEGSIKTRNYENNDGQRIYVTEIDGKMILTLAAASGGSMAPAAEETVIPVLEKTAAPAAENFDFNEAIKKESPFEVTSQLGEDVPF